MIALIFTIGLVLILVVAIYYKITIGDRTQEQATRMCYTLTLGAIFVLYAIKELIA